MSCARPVRVAMRTAIAVGMTACDDVFDRLPLDQADQRQDEGGADGSADRRIELPADDPGDGEGDERQC